MIIDGIENGYFYAKCHPYFSQRFQIIQEGNFEDLNADMNPVKGMPFRAMRVRLEGQDRENVNLGNHHQNIDLDFFISGTE